MHKGRLRRLSLHSSAYNACQRGIRLNGLRLTPSGPVSRISRSRSASAGMRSCLAYVSGMETMNSLLSLSSIAWRTRVITCWVRIEGKEHRETKTSTARQQFIRAETDKDHLILSKVVCADRQQHSQSTLDHSRITEMQTHRRHDLHHSRTIQNSSY